MNDLGQYIQDIMYVSCSLFFIGSGYMLYRWQGLKRQVVQLQETLARQERFTSDVAHELRNPVTAILGHADVLLRWGKDEPTVREECLAAIGTEGKYMEDVICRLLYISRIQQGTLHTHFQMIEASEFTQEMYDTYRPRVTKQTFRLGSLEPAVMRADSGSVQQLLRIFLDNAIKYTPDGGVITIGCHTDRNMVVYTVQDTGIGMSLANQRHIFERHFRVDSQQVKSIGGSGLGLSIAKELAEANHGTIHVQSVIGIGTTMSLRFPVVTVDSV